MKGATWLCPGTRGRRSQLGPSARDVIGLMVLGTAHRHQWLDFRQRQCLATRASTFVDDMVKFNLTAIREQHDLIKWRSL